MELYSYINYIRVTIYITYFTVLQSLRNEVIRYTFTVF